MVKGDTGYRIADGIKLKDDGRLMLNRREMAVDSRSVPRFWYHWMESSEFPRIMMSCASKASPV